MSFELQIARVLKVEGGYVNDPNDRGGETNWGITVAVARAYGYDGPMRDMTRDQALWIYRRRYWDSQLLDVIEPLSYEIAHELLDTGVNMGVERSGIFLQRALNALNTQGRLYPDTKVDGRIGQMTVAALREFLNARGKNGEIVMLRALNSLQGAFYVEISESRPKNEEFTFGWFLQRVSF